MPRAPRPAGCRVNPSADLHGAADETPTTVAPVSVPESMSVEQGVAQRKQAAAALAPGGENGIGPPIARGDSGRAAVMATTCVGEATEPRTGQ